MRGLDAQVRAIAAAGLPGGYGFAAVNAFDGDYAAVAVTKPETWRAAIELT